jgi:hypothetical protein
MSVEGGLVAQHFFGHLKRALELLISVRMGPPAIFQDHWEYAIILEKKKKQKQINTHP